MSTEYASRCWYCGQLRTAATFFCEHCGPPDSYRRAMGLPQEDRASDDARLWSTMQLGRLDAEIDAARTDKEQER